MEALLLPIVNNHLLPSADQHSFRPGYSTTSALLQLTSDIATGFNQMKPPHHTVCVAVVLTATFDTVNHKVLLSKIVRSTLPEATCRNYIRGRQSVTSCRGVKSKAMIVHTVVQKYSKMSSTSFSFFYQNTQQCTTHGNAPKGSGSYLRQSTHIHNISVHAHNPLQIKKALTATGWGKQKETLMATYKAVMIPALEYASSVWSPIASSTSINKLQVMQNAALRTATGCTQDTNIQHLHDETLTLPIHEHLQLHASQYKQKTQHPSHPLHKHTTYFNTPRLINPLFLTTAATQQTFPQTPTQSLQQT